MHDAFTPKQTLIAVAVIALFSNAPAQAQVQPASVAEAATVVVTGTRVANRTALDTASPVDIISADSIKNAGTTELSQALSIALPSLNFPRPGLADGTDTIRPATLRGMGPDQTLVLVNSKRRHTSSLVNTNGTIGRGSASVDLNTIPTAIIKTIEVLRDGAAAQYGSDAISGVVNLRLRTNREGGEATISYGGRVTEYDFIVGTPPAGAPYGVQNSRKRTDGQIGTASIWKGLPWGETGHITLAAEIKDQRHTERSGYDVRRQYPVPPGGGFDPRETTINRFNAWYGEPELKQATLFVNAGNTLANGAKIYGWSSYQRRDAKSAGQFRGPADARNIPSIYPDGFLPIIAPVVDDFSATGGVNWTLEQWDMDMSLGFGNNKMMYTIENSLNRSLGPTSKTEFDAGGYSYNQLVLNLTGVRTYAVAGLASPLNVAVGMEGRREGYKLYAGEPDSYRQGNFPLPNGGIAAPGAQVFPGFQQKDAIDAARTAVGAFVDVEANITDKLLASAAIRAEHYSDYGNSLAGKLASRYDFNKSFALRGSLQNGFRAPSPQQQYFTTTSTNFLNGVPFEITTFRPTDPVAAFLGAKPLEAEKSVNLSLGAVMRFGSVNLTVDAYRIDVEDRIVLSENLNQPAVQAFLRANGYAGGGGRFFINGVDTTNEGVDVVLAWPMNAGAAGKFDFTLAGNFSKTEVTKVPELAVLQQFEPAPPLFARVNRLTIERGQPRNKINASVNWKLGDAGITLRATRYGEVLSPGTGSAPDVLISPKTIVDIESRYALSRRINLAFGVENISDEYPESVPVSINGTGNTPFPNYAPYGRGGRFVYARASYTF
ncbi:TonB-dependent receptor [Massilia sp. PAMC28688]|uniref:TonB-dependent receptor plug domain-containing protein n=1 Tax=Massilia sp. PAMC28688 TaxID=2861283 RepID=UPI001C62F124|nr:TonB-dependent receptor [Massilia sp. PAMC28688]QYF95248.1 TonB-dependent receptor [Massilia sp. PAMC28688]